MRVAVACDHGGYPLKEVVIKIIRQLGHDPIDLGTNSQEKVDIPDYAEKAGRLIQQGEAERAVLICGSGVGACVSANKLVGVYAAVCHDTYSAREGVEHDQMNALCLGGRVVGTEVTKEVVKTFLLARFIPEGRYKRRVEKIKLIESENLAGAQQQEQK
jgi:ribose 5-phosphate isomerase B